MSAARILALVAAAALVALALWRRKHVGLLAAAALALAAGAADLVSVVPDPEKAIADVAETLGAWTYALVGAMAFLETGAFVGLLVGIAAVTAVSYFSKISFLWYNLIGCVVVVVVGLMISLAGPRQYTQTV